MGHAAGHVARRRFGQHFLVDASVIDAIVAAIDPREGQVIVEIGPGLAALTAALLGRVRHLHAVEIDRDLAARLQRRWGPDRLDLHQADALRFDFSRIAPGDGAAPPLRLVGNLPYNISSPLLVHLLAFRSRIADQHFMLQKEVVQRMVATPGHKDYGRLSVMLQWRYAMQALLDVAPEAFEPPPRVDSAVVRMQPRPDAAAVDAGLLSELVAVAFSQRRKLLRHTLGRWLDGRAAGADFDCQRRAEEVPVAEYLALAGRLMQRATG